MRTLHKRSIKAALIGSTVAAAVFAGAGAASANVWTYHGTYWTLASCQAQGRYGEAHFGWVSYACDSVSQELGTPAWDLYSFD